MAFQHDSDGSTFRLDQAIVASGSTLKIAAHSSAKTPEERAKLIASKTPDESRGHRRAVVVQEVSHALFEKPDLRHHVGHTRAGPAW